MRLSGKTALVTGAASGIGAASALALARDGADLVLLDVNRAALEQMARQVEATGRQVAIFACDVADDERMGEHFEDIRERFGTLDVVHANAGINGTWAPIDDLTPDEWDLTIRVNLRGTYVTLHHAVPLMQEKGGSIIITSSIMGTRSFTIGGATAYAATKAGQLAMGQMLALELASYGIRVNVICPGQIKTGIGASTFRRHVARSGVKINYPDGYIPLTGGEPAEPAEVAKVVAFLASDDASHITGTPVWIDGGQSLLT
jgi:NAD(P)-dependent dehydrogenase (short-subunit alcohol dehydrogenase family)